jgi:hypothetical protein
VNDQAVRRKNSIRRSGNIRLRDARSDSADDDGLPAVVDAGRRPPSEIDAVDRIAVVNEEPRRPVVAVAHLSADYEVAGPSRADLPMASEKQRGRRQGM